MRTRILAIALAVGGASCKPAAQAPPAPPAASADAGPLQVVEVEPNDAQHAQGIPERAVVAGSIAPHRLSATDDDWYRVTPGPGRLLALRIELGPAAQGGAALDASLEIYDRDRNRLLRAHASAKEPALLPAVACLEACFVRVSGKAQAAYRLSVLGEPPRAGEELEPNDRAVDATPLPAGSAASGTFGSAEDEDWFRVTVDAPKPGQFLRLELSGVPGVRPEMEVRALEDATLLATLRSPREGEGIFVRDLSLAPPPPLPAPPPLALLPTSADGGSAPVAPLAAPAPSVPTAVATPAATQPATAELPDAGAAMVPAPSALAGYYIVLRSTWIASDRPGGRPHRGASPRVPYSLRTALEDGPPDLEREPNDDPAQATDLGSGTRQGYLSPAGDVDWYRVHTDAPALLRAEVSALQRADVELSVWLPGAHPGERPTQLARVNEGGVREGEVLPSVGLHAGDALIKVESAPRSIDGRLARDGEDRETLYKLVATLSPDDGAHDREPNDDLPHAQQVPLPARLTGTLWPKRDVDVYRFHVPGGRPPVDIELSAVRGLDLMLTLREIKQGAKGEEAEVIGTADQRHGEGEESLLAVPLKEGDYAVEVSSPRKDGSATQAYTLSIR